MAGGKCKRRAVRFGKRAARFLGPVLGPLVPRVVETLRLLGDSIPELAGGHAKRRAVLAAVGAQAREIGHEAWDEAALALNSAAEGYVRAHIENSLESLTGGESLATLEAWSDSDFDPTPDDDDPVE